MKEGKSAQLHWEWYGASGLKVPASVVGPAGAFALPLDGRSGLEAPEWLRILDSLLTAEVAAFDEEEGLVVGPLALEDLEEHEKRALELPSELEGAQFRLVSKGIPGQSTFRLLLEVSPPGHPTSLEDSARQGAFVEVQGKLFRLPPALLGLVEVLDSVRGEPSTPADLRRVAMAKARAIRAGVAVDGFIRREELVAPEGLTVEAEFVAPDELRLRALPVGAEDFEELIATSEPSELYSRVVGPDKRRRLLLAPDQVKAVEDLRRRPVLRGADVARFQENPDAFLPELFDLSRFSPRVKGIVPYRYRSQPYLSVRSSGSRGWFDIDMGAGAIRDEDAFSNEGSLGPALPPGEGSGDRAPTIEHGPRPRDQTPRSPSFGPEEFAELCRRVLETGEEYVLHEGEWIKISREEAESFLETWSRASESGEGENGIDEAGLSFVLDVATNLEVLEYVDETEVEVSGPRLGELQEPLPEYPLPGLLRAKLRPYQVEGYRWLRNLHERRWGGLLADDMGLGKTVQVIALLAYLKEIGELTPALIVVPNSLVHNWQRELRKFCPEIRRVYVHQGGERSRIESFLAANEVVITTYETFRLDQHVLAAVDWSAAICDEAQKIKNPSAKVTSALKAAKARVRVAMTGTPVENGLMELWCIADFVQAGRLGTGREFRTLVERPIVESTSGSEVQSNALEHLHERLGPHYLRRTKNELKDELPPRESRSYPVGMGDRQRLVYSRVTRAVASREEIPIAGLQRLIQACSHPELVEPVGATGEQLLDECPKLRSAMGLIGDIRAAGEKVLVFTRFKRMQAILQEAITREHGFYPSIINGEVGNWARLETIAKFEAGPGFAALILSPEAAGVGLNITAANHVIHYSRLWNPAKEMQATDRVYRIGQSRPVYVHYPIVTGDGWKTVEEHLDELLREKAELAENVIVPTERLEISAALQRRVLEDVGA